jgi:group II intron reverse transcriptase/maturase
MQTAEHILQALQKLGQKRTPLTRVYRSLYSEDLFLLAYDRIGRNKGSLTPGTDDDTADGMSLETIRNVIELLRYERFKFRPSRRIEIPKKSGGKRPLSIPNFTEKLVQEVLRLILEAYYEPRFRDSSHGFRPDRGCDTALVHIKQKFRGSAWFIEGDIRKCFDSIDHEVLMEILSKDIQDGRLLNLIRQCLQAGYLEDWKYHKTFSGTPQGGVLSPLLSNIYLHELDVFIEDVLIPQYTRGKRRAKNPEYDKLDYHIRRARAKGDMDTAHELELQRRRIPSQVVDDPNFRRLTYCRYADDFILGFIGSRAEAEDIKQAVGAFLRETLHLEMHETKTLVTHARTQQARFLNYAISIYHSDTKLVHRANSQTKARSANGHIRLGIPFGLIDEKIRRYQIKGKAVPELGMLYNSDVHIIDVFQARYRGLANYYKYAVDRHKLNRLKYVMEISLTKTLARKYKRSVSKIYREYKGTRTVDGRTYKTLQVAVPTKKGVRLIYWGAISLKPVKVGMEPIKDIKPPQYKTGRSDLIQRLQADTCEICGAGGRCEVHHVRKLADLKKRWKGRKSKPAWVKRMIALHRKTLIVCLKCHREIHSGKAVPS